MDTAENLELLAPAGSYETMVAAIRAGADAVYAGGSRFSARAYADNFTDEQLLRAIDYAHLKGKKIMLAVNTLMKDPEMEELCEWISPFYEAGLDAAIIQDIGVFSVLKENFPGLPLHASTQMTITSANGAKLLERMGAVRAVLARELSLDEIRKIREQTSLELEAFVHGALCYCYSGKCLMSSLIGGRSGNRGKCAQPCRLPYRLTLPDGQTEKETYCLSLKDFCAIGQLPQMVEAGIQSFKIEGRMKQAEYTAGVVSVYRKYLDCILQGKNTDPYTVSAKDYQALLDCGNRNGFTNRYLSGQTGKEMLSGDCPSHIKRTENSAAEKKVLTSEQKEPLYAKLTLAYKKPTRLCLRFGRFETVVEGEPAERAQTQAISEEEAVKKIAALGTTFFEIGSLETDIEEDLFVPGGVLKKLRRDAVKELEQQIFTDYRRQARRPLSKDKPQTQTGSWHGKTGRLSVLVSTKEQLDAVWECGFVNRIYLSADLWKDYVQTPPALTENYGRTEQNPEVFCAFPDIICQSTVLWLEKYWDSICKMAENGFLANSYDAIGFLLQKGVAPDRIVPDSTIYHYSEKAAEYLYRNGFSNLTVPVELNYQELKHRSLGRSELIIYGKQLLMYSTQCLLKNYGVCKNKDAVLTLTDRKKKKFCVHTHCTFCYNTIYNYAPLFLLHHAQEIRSLHLQGYRIDFLEETKEQVNALLDGFFRSFYKGETLLPKQYAAEYTNGHWKRGVD
ncbi:MAG: U32 family peptidase [Eubacterium sp.]|nr:U32 family peptidase [Eubacterium sp.]